jgi:hypothetical protein
VHLRPEEPPATKWHREPLADVSVEIMEGSPIGGRPFILGIDGRSSSGKTSLAERIGETITNSSTVHTDDVAWHHSIFGWDDLLIEGVLAPLRRGEAVNYRPQAWEERGRTGAITVPNGRRLVIIEGVGAGRRELAKWLDGLVWVQADELEIGRREAARVASGEVDRSVQEAWHREEIIFLADQRPWGAGEPYRCGNRRTLPMSCSDSCECVESPNA